jgi:hypothetical protein
MQMNRALLANLEQLCKARPARWLAMHARRARLHALERVGGSVRLCCFTAQ